MSSTPTPFPFERVLSLSHLIAFWRRVADDEDAPRRAAARLILESLADAPELAQPITDPAVLEVHRDLVDQMMSAVIPQALWEESRMGTCAPFDLEMFYTTPSFRRLELFNRGRPLLPPFSKLDDPSHITPRVIRAYHWILNRFYGTNLPEDHPILFIVEDQETGLETYYKLEINTRFASIEVRDTLKELSRDEIERLLAEPFNLPLWREILPPDPFVFTGFVVVTATDVTPQAVTSALKDDLLRKDAMATPSDIEHLQHRLRALLRQPDLELGLICLEHDDIEGITGARTIGHSLLLESTGAPSCPYKADSFYARVFERSEPLVVSDLACCDVCTGFEKHLQAQGIRTLLLAPLRYEGRLIGILELGSRTPNAVNAMSALKLAEAFSLFATAMKRMIDEREDRIQSVIKQYYTAIHPAVEWRFREAALRYLETHRHQKSSQVEPIVFHDVYPLYGLSDVRDSSAHRSRAVQADLQEQLGLALAVIIEAAIYRPLPILDEMSFRLSRFANRIGPESSTEDETGILEFLRQEVEPLFPQLGAFGPRVRQRIEAYNDALDPDLRLLYRQRKDFDESITLISDTIAEYLHAQQEQAQAMFPHYFELFKTDGVDYNIYVGPSLVQDASFDDLYLHNLRLWQLMTMCGIVWKLKRLRPRLPMSLDTTHLILVQSAPLSIRFRMEEKQFDVDGAYNIRYEIIKKRIDKAVVAGTGERLTQPGRIAIVYSQTREAQEYRRYLEYLGAAGYLTGEVEMLDLEPMQGVHGLKALRVAVSEEPPVSEIDVVSGYTGSVAPALE